MRPEPAPASSAPGRGSAGGSALGGRGVGPWDPPPSQELGSGAVSARWSPEVLGSVSETKWLSRPNQVLVQPPGSVSNFEGGLKEQSLGFKSHLPSGKTYLRNPPRTTQDGARVGARVAVPNSEPEAEAGRSRQWIHRRAG